ncbi:MAG: hypothetical protein Q4F80_03400, partial [bacterium]|nr:hypothetical protein [bacterium]
LRALFFARDGFIHHFETADIRCHCMPVNSELFYTWILSLFKTDCCFGLLQFFSYFLLMVSGYKIMGIYEIEFKKRLWALLIFSSFAGVISQVSSTQTDLCTGALLSSSLYLVLKYDKDKRLINLFYSSLAMGIAFGVKSTGVIGSLPLIIWYCFILRKDIFKYLGFLVFNFIIFSSYNYVLNYVNYGNWVGAQTAINEHALVYSNFFEFLKGGFANLIRYILQFFDFSGLMLFYLLTPLYDNFVQGLFNFLHINPLFNSNGEVPHLNATLSEQLTGLGILSFIALLPAFIKAFFDKNLKPLCLVFMGQVIILSFTIVYFPTTIRFFIAYFAILLPVLTLTYKKGNHKKLITFIAAFYLIFTPLFLTQRPFIKIIAAYKNSPSIKALTDNIRNVKYDFYFISKKHVILKDETESLGKNVKVGIFLNDGFMAYPVKYSDYTKKVKIDFLNFSKNPNTDEYDYIIFENNFQSSSIPVKNPGANCNYTYFANKITGNICFLSEETFKNFSLYKKVEYKADSFLKKTGNDNDTVFYILKNNVTKY